MKTDISNSRRGFFKKFLLSVLTFSLFKPSKLFALKLFSGKSNGDIRGRGIVISAKNKNYSKKTSVENRHKTVKELFDKSLLKLTGEKSTELAWRSIIKKDDIVGLKLNCLAAPELSPSPELVDAIVQGLKTVIGENNIIIWERSDRELIRAGFKINRSGSGVRCFGTDSLRKPFESKIQMSGSIGSLFSNIIVKNCTAIINVGVLKDHYLSGVGAGMKNFYGVIHNPNKYHDNNCDPYIADICNHTYVKDKLRLTVIDGLLCQWEGGPAYSPSDSQEFNSIITGFDPVAIDRVAYDIIDEMRKKKGLKDLKEEKRYPAFIFSADKLGLGESDLKKIRLFKV